MPHTWESAKATHRHGCCVLQRCIAFVTHQQRQVLINCIAQHALSLSPVSSFVSCALTAALTSGVCTLGDCNSCRVL